MATLYRYSLFSIRLTQEQERDKTHRGRKKLCSFVSERSRRFDRIHKRILNECDRTINREYVYSVAVHQKYLTRLGELIIFEPWRDNYHFSQPS